MIDETLLAAILLAGNGMPRPREACDDTLAYYVDAAHKLTEFDARWREWRLAAANYERNFVPCSVCDELPAECDCIPF